MLRSANSGLQRDHQGLTIEPVPANLYVIDGQNRHVITILLNPVFPRIHITHNEHGRTPAEGLSLDKHFDTKQTAATAVNDDFAHRQPVSL